MDLSTFLNLLSLIGALALLLVTGFLCRRLGIMDDVASKRFSKLIITVGQPMMIVAALIGKEFSPALFKEGLLYMGLGFLLHPVLALFALLTGPIYRDPGQRKISQFATIFTNCGFIGLPILNAVFPGKGAFIGAFFLIGFHVYVWTLGIVILGQGREDIKLTPRKALLNYGTVPCAIGLGLYVLQAVVPIPAPIVTFTDSLGDLCMPISVLITGGLMATLPLKRVFTNLRLYMFNVLKLIAIPLAVCLLAKLATLGLPRESAYPLVLFCTVVSALPSAATVTMLAELYDLDAPYAAQTVGSTSLLSIGTLPLLYVLGDLIARI
ncbi:MAG: AEC family transporter [Clostridia bacterium]|nr:AEC family transporter [Clostridia bacterium]